MKQAFPSISPETKAKLQERGFKPLKTDPLPDWQNPYSNSCNEEKLPSIYTNIYVNYSSKYPPLYHLL